MEQPSRVPLRTLKPIAEILRPIVKRLIVEAAIRGVISHEKATALIRERGLGDA